MNSSTQSPKIHSPVRKQQPPLTKSEESKVPTGSAVATDPKAPNDVAKFKALAGDDAVTKLSNRNQNRPETGRTFEELDDLEGKSKLRIINGLSDDAVVVLTVAGSLEASCSFYIRAHDEYELGGVSEGSYDVYFETGTNWSSPRLKFLSPTGFSKFRDHIAFEVKKEEDGISYTSASITLHGVPNGNVHKVEIQEASFPKLHIRR